MLTMNDFRAPIPENAKFPIYFRSKISYRVDTIIQRSKNRYQVFVKTQIKQKADESSWDSTKVNKDDIQRVLAHEQGHLYLAYICGNNIEKAMPTFNFTSNWKEEVRKKFFELLSKERKRNEKYDEETAHGIDLKNQAKWNKWFKKELEGQ